MVSYTCVPIMLLLVSISGLGLGSMMFGDIGLSAMIGGGVGVVSGIRFGV